MDAYPDYSDTDAFMGDPLGDNGLRIKIIGIGGAGTNAVDRMKLEDLAQVHLTAIDSDSQVLAASPVEETFLLGERVTCGKSTGGSVEKGRKAAESDREALRQLVRHTDLVFLVAGLGGGTGSGGAPVLAELAVQEGALVIAFCPMPFNREGSARCEKARLALEALQKRCHAVIPLPNEVVFQQVEANATLMEAFAMADKWIKMGVHSIWSMLFNTGLINVDFSTLQTALDEPGGKTLFGTGYGKGEDFVEAALEDLDRCPLLHLPEGGFVKETDQLIVNLTGGPDLTMAMVNRVMDAISEKFACRHSMVMGASIDGSFFGQLRITVMGTIRRMASGRSFAPVPAASIPDNEPVRAAPRSKQSQPGLTGAPSLKEQKEFAFLSHEENRGFFEKTQLNLYQGMDLDVPTFLRRGLKVARTQ